MLIVMRSQIGGYRNGAPWPPAGGTIDVPDHEAADLIAHRYAVAAQPDQGTADDQTPTVDDVDPPTVDDELEPAGDDVDQAADDELEPPATKRRRGTPAPLI